MPPSQERSPPGQGFVSSAASLCRQRECGTRARAVKQLEKKDASGILPCAGPLHRRGDGNREPPTPPHRSPAACRPRSLEEFVGQEAYSRARANSCDARSRRIGCPRSFLSGPPGTGKDDARANHRGDDAVKVRPAERRGKQRRRDAQSRGGGGEPAAHFRVKRRSSSSMRFIISTKRSRTFCCPTWRAEICA